MRRQILVAATIFILMTAIAVVSYQNANRKARDGRRQADLESVRSALEIYRSDNDEYHNPGWGALQPDYIKVLPTDPRPSTRQYYYTATATTYSVCAALEAAVTSPCTVVGGAGCTENCN